MPKRDKVLELYNAWLDDVAEYFAKTKSPEIVHWYLDLVRKARRTRDATLIATIQHILYQSGAKELFDTGDLLWLMDKMGLITPPP